MISSLKLLHWKSHESTSVSFGRGSNLFVGQMGSGKTSVLEAVCFALFGTFPNLKNRKVSLEDVVMRQPARCSDAEASVEIESNGKKYSITRVVRLGKDGVGSTEGFLRENGKLIEGPQTQRVTEAVQNILKVDYELFARTAYAEQNKIDYFLVLPKAERKRQADELLGIDKFESVRANAGSVANKLRALEAEAKSFLAGANAAALEQEFAENSEKARELETELAALEKKEKTLVAGRDESAAALELLEKKRVEFETLQRGVSATRALLEDAGREIEARKLLAGALEKGLGIPIAGAQSALERAEEELRAKREELSALQKGAGESASTEKTLGRNIEDIRRKAQEKQLLLKRKTDALLEFPGGIANAATQMRGDVERAQGEANAVEAETLALKSAVAALGVAQADCPVCGAILSGEHKKNLDAEKKAALEKLIEKKREAEKTLGNVRKKAEELEEKRLSLSKTEERLSELLNLESELASAESARAREEARKNQLEEKAGALLIELQSAEKSLSGTRSLAQAGGEISKLGEKISSATARLQGEEKKLALQDFSQIALDGARKKFEGAVVALGELRAEKSAKNGALNEKKAFLSSAGNRLVSVRKKEEESRRLGEKAAAMLSFQNAVLETQLELRETLVGAVNEALETMWAMLYPYGDYSSVRLNAAEDYSLELMAKNGEWTGIECASGGEKSCASLSLRIAFAMVLTPNLSWLVLDEPTHNLDTEAVGRLTVALREEIPKVFEQVFIITHDENLKEGASAKIYRVQRDKERGGESIVEEIPIGENE